MTFQPCRPATIKLLPYGGAPFRMASSFLTMQILLRGLDSLDGLDQHGGDLEQVAADAVVGDLEDGSSLVLVHGDDALGILHSHQTVL